MRGSKAALPLHLPWPKAEDYQAAVKIKPVHLASYFLEHRMKSKNVLFQTLRRIRELFLPEGTEEVLQGLVGSAGFSILRV